MLLRRMIDHVKAQNWTAVGLDFCIVVVGVFIGIQVSNWNDTRIARSEESVLLRQLSAELMSIERESAGKAAVLERHAAHTLQLAEMLRLHDTTPNAEDFVALIDSVRRMPLSVERSATYQELIAGGGLHKISSHSLRGALVQHDLALVDAKELHEHQSNFLQPHLARLFYLQAVLDEVPFNEALDASGGKLNLLVALKAISEASAVLQQRNETLQLTTQTLLEELPAAE